MNESEKTKDIGLEETQAIGNAEAHEGTEAQTESPAPKRGWKALSKNAKIGIGASCAAVVAAAEGIGAFAMTHQVSTLPADEPVESAALVAETEEGTPQKVTFTLVGYEPKEGDTPLIVHVSGTTDGNRGVDFYHKIDGASGDMELDPGAYAVEALPVLTAEGGLLTAEGGQAAAAVDDDAVEVSREASAKPADQVTEDDVKSLLDKVAEAVAKGDGTLKGDAGKAAAAKVAEAAKAAGKLDAAKVEEAEKKAEEASNGAAQANTFAASTATPVDTGSEAPAQSTTNANPTGGSSSISNQPAHEHSWQPVTEQKWVSNNVWVQDSAAWDEQISNGEVIQASCGATFDSVDAWFAHQTRNHHCSYSVVQNYRTIHHDTTGHYEDQGHYETATIGYRCSGCGATK